MDQARLEEVNQLVEQLAEGDSEIGESLRRMFPSVSGARWLYRSRHGYRWHFKKRGRRLFGYTTERINGKFASFVYLCTTVGHMEKRQVVYHTRRQDADERAERLMEKYVCPCTDRKCGKPEN